MAASGRRSAAQQVELRRVLEPADFEGQLPPEILENEARLRAQTASPAEG